VNETLVQGNEQATFVALVCGVLDTWSGALRYASGGGLAPLLRENGAWRTLAMPRGLVVGAIPGFAFEQARVKVPLGGALVLFSDGVTEARSPSGELFGSKRLGDVLAAAGTTSALGLIEAVRGAVRAFEAGAPPADDLTLLVVVRPPRA
jgi:sigma-B regulation protein RsbU (phosphoserine phosphatase)